MTSDTITRAEATTLPASDGFGQLLHAEWTKFRTVRGWVIAMIIAAVVIVGFGLMPGLRGSCGQHGPASECILPVGPDGEVVTDTFSFARLPLTGDGSLTVRVTSLTGQPTSPPGNGGKLSGQGEPDKLPSWAKAGLIIKADTRPGSTYAAIMVTGGHGVRMQDDFLHDTAGRPGAVSAASPRWLRLTRSGDTITGQESPDGTTWRTVGTVHLPGLGSTAQAGLFTTSPQYAEIAEQSLGAMAVQGGPTRAAAAFDHVERRGGWPSQDWIGEQVGRADDPGPAQNGDLEPSTPQDGIARSPVGPQGTGLEQHDGVLTLSGSGDIAPTVAGAAGGGTSISQTLVGTFGGLIIVIVVGALFITTEYRRGLIRTTLTASPRRSRILAAKAIVVAAVSFLTGLVAAALVVTLGQRTLRGDGVYVLPTSTFTELRVVVGTAALLAVAAVLALAIGALLRRSATAVATVIVVIMVPYLLAVAILPGTDANWLTRITPASAFALQQSTPRYPQVDNIYTPAGGYFPLPPWAGFGVLCAWAALALGLAMYRFNRTDA
jgi:ABC-type transport system involved in multi-copper enzyme maturation permease subunit